MTRARNFANHPATVTAAGRGRSSTFVAAVRSRATLASLIDTLRETSIDVALHLLSAPGGVTTRDAEQLARGGQRVAVVEAGASIETLTSADYVVLLPEDLALSACALRHVDAALRKEPCDWLYTDEERLLPDGHSRTPVLKGGFSPELALTDDFATGLAVVRTRLLRGATSAAVTTRAGLHEVFLRLIEDSSVRVRHLPEVCAVQSHAAETSCRTLTTTAAAIERRRLAANAVVRTDHRCSRVSVAWRRTPYAPITIVIPTRDRLDLLRPCLDSLARTVAPSLTRLLILDDESEDPETRDYLASVTKHVSLPSRVLRVRRPGAASAIRR
jgi:hypothetical protein